MITRSKNRMPTHPGAILREDVMPELDITQFELAKRLGVSRRTVSEILHERRPVTPDVALRLAYFLDTTATSWLNMQQAVDLWCLEQKRGREYSSIRRMRLSAAG